MNAYLFCAGSIVTAVVAQPNRNGQTVETVQTWDGVSSAIFYGPDAEIAQECFEAWLHRSEETEHPAHMAVKKLVAAQLVDQLLTEAGNLILGWPEIAQRTWDRLQTIEQDDFEQGYWVELNQVCPSENISADLDSLQRELPDDIRSGLNWDPEKQFYFLLTILSPWSPPAAIPEVPDELPPDSDDTAMEIDKAADLDLSVQQLPELRDKEAAALIQARNSVVAAWLWRKYAADTRLARNEIYVTACCPILPTKPS